MATDAARGVLAEVAVQLRAAQHEVATDAALARAFGMVATRAEDLADGATSLGDPRAAASTDPCDVLARVWGLLRSRPLPEYPPEVAILALWLMDLADLISRRNADDPDEEVRHVL